MHFKNYLTGPRVFGEASAFTRASRLLYVTWPSAALISRVVRVLFVQLAGGDADDAGGFFGLVAAGIKAGRRSRLAAS